MVLSGNQNSEHFCGKLVPQIPSDLLPGTNS